MPQFKFTIKQAHKSDRIVDSDVEISMRLNRNHSYSRTMSIEDLRELSDTIKNYLDKNDENN